MRPQIILKTSFPFQNYIIEEHASEEDMEDLRSYRDAVIDVMSENVQFLDIMEDIAGMSFQEFRLDAWIFKGREERISSPIMLPQREDPDVTFFELAFLIAKELVYQNKPDLDHSDMLEPGLTGIDVTAGMLAYRAVSEAAENDLVDRVLDHDAFAGEQEKTWEQVEKKVEEWEESELTDFLGLGEIEE